MRILFFFFIIGLVGCNKPNPNPELSDQIYQDLQSLAQATLREGEAEKKKFDELKKELNTAIPQSGTIKRIQKRYFESELRIQKLEQLKKYYELKAESRKSYTRVEYLKSFRSGKPWPTEEELTAYKQYKELNNEKKSWSTRERVKKYESTNGIQAFAPEIQKKPEKKDETNEKLE